MKAEKGRYYCQLFFKGSQKAKGHTPKLSKKIQLEKKKTGIQFLNKQTTITKPNQNKNKTKTKSCMCCFFRLENLSSWVIFGSAALLNMSACFLLCEFYSCTELIIIDWRKDQLSEKL